MQSSIINTDNNIAEIHFRISRNILRAKKRLFIFRGNSELLKFERILRQVYILISVFEHEFRVSRGTNRPDASLPRVNSYRVGNGSRVDARQRRVHEGKAREEKDKSIFLALTGVRARVHFDSRLDRLSSILTSRRNSNDADGKHREARRCSLT